MMPRDEALQLLEMLRANIVDDLALTKEIRGALSDIDGYLQRIARAEGADAAALRARLQYHRDEIGEELLQAKFRLAEAGNLLLHCGRMISEACGADELMDALMVAGDVRPAILAEGGVPLLHAIFAHGAENSRTGMHEFVDADQQPLTWQFNIAMIDWMCRSDAGSEAANQAFEQTFGVLPDDWKKKPTVLEKCGVSR